jgi:tetratricopeptide (TPR) repeat protein
LKIADKTHTETGGGARAAQLWQGWAAIALLVVAVSAAYANSFHGPFVFDDKPSIVENLSIRHLGSLQVLAASPDAVTTAGRPVVNLSLAINYAIGGLEVEGYHVLNLGIHILAALALFGLVRRTLLVPILSARFGAASTGLALTVALLWAVHPLQTESVTYIVQRAEAMVGLFYLLTLYCLLRGAITARGTGWYAAAVGSCALGMASKEVMVSAPLVALLYHRVFISGSFKESLRRRWRLWLALSATWILLVLVVYLSQHRGGSAGFGLGMTAWQYARRQFGCIIHYLRLAFWPSPLVLDYGNAAIKDAAQLVPSAIGVCLLVASTAAALALRPAWGFLGVCFFAILAPTSSIVPLAGQVEAEHRMYLPLAAVVVLVVLAAYRAVARSGLQLRRAVVVLIPAVAAVLSWETYQRNQVYQSELVLWDNTVRSCPLNYRAYHNRGNAYMARGQYDAALKDFGKVVELNPRDAKSYNYRGNVYSAAGRYDEAIIDYSKAIQLKPDLADAYNGRGTAYGNKGYVDAAIADFDRAIGLDGGMAEAYYNRGNAHGAKGQMDAAIKDYEQAIGLRPDYADAYNHRGGAYDSKGQFDAAIKDYDQAIELRPSDADVFNNRGNAYQNKGQYDAAIRDYDRAIALQPDHTVAYLNRAIALSQTKAYDKAWADVRMVRQLGATPSPDFLEALTKASGRSE